VRVSKAAAVLACRAVRLPHGVLLGKAEPA
jgi:hypothetical protein